MTVEIPGASGVIYRVRGKFRMPLTNLLEFEPLNNYNGIKIERRVGDD